MMASAAGGVDIEEVARTTPEKIIKVFVDPMLGLQGYHCRQAAFGLNLPAAAVKQRGHCRSVSVHFIVK